MRIGFYCFEWASIGSLAPVLETLKESNQDTPSGWKLAEVVFWRQTIPSE